MTQIELEAEKLSVDYAQGLGLDVAETVSINVEYEGFWIFRRAIWARIVLETDAGTAESTISINPHSVHSFILEHRNDRELLPLWIAFPRFNSVTIGWRQGTGEPYKYRWHDWWRTLSETQKQQYKLKFPEPTDEDRGEWYGGWENFYEEIAEVPGDRDSIPDLLFGRVPPPSSDEHP